MPKFGVSPETVEKRKPVDAGTYEVRLVGWKPKLAKKKDSVNLNPQLEIINHPKYNNKRLFFGLNTKADWLFTELNHCFGVQATDAVAGQPESLAGEFIGPDNNPEAWTYNGPLMNNGGRVEVVQIDDENGVPQSEIKLFYCNVPGCTFRHSQNLIKTK